MKAACVLTPPAAVPYYLFFVVFLFFFQETNLILKIPAASHRVEVCHLVPLNMQSEEQ